MCNLCTKSMDPPEPLKLEGAPTKLVATNKLLFRIWSDPTAQRLGSCLFY